MHDAQRLCWGLTQISPCHSFTCAAMSCIALCPVLAVMLGVPCCVVGCDRVWAILPMPSVLAADACWLPVCVVCRLHGTRDAVTAALHIALGDCTALDVGRMVTLPPSSAQQQPAAAAAGTDQQATAAQGQACSAGQGAAEWQQAGAAPSPVQAGLWDAGLSVGSHSELLLGRGEVASSSTAAEATAHEAAAAAAGEAQAGRSVQQSRKQRQQQRRLQKEQRKRSRQQPPAQAQQQQHVSLHVPLLRHFVCVANYGFLGDVMETSERLRWCGPVR